MRRSVVALLVSVFCGNAAAMAGATVLGKQVYDLTHRPFDLGLLGLAEFAPAAVLVLLTGSVADRFDRRRVAAIAICGETMAALALAWYASTEPTAAGPIFLLVLAFGTARAFVAPSTRALPADIVPPDRLPWLMPRQSAVWQAALVVGPVAAGFLYAVDTTLPYLLMAALFVVGALSVLMVTVREERVTRSSTVIVERALEAGVEGGPTPADATEAPRAGLSEAFEGLRFIKREPVLLGAISLDLFAVLFGGAVALLPAIAEERLGVGSVGLGWLRAAAGIGAGLVTLVLALRPVTRRVGRTLLVAVGVFGVATIVLGLTRSYVIAFIALAVLSGADSFSVFIRATLVPLVTPGAMRGRVLAVENVFIGASNELGAFESGIVGSLVGPPAAIVFGGAATIAVAGAWASLFPALRDVDRFPSSVNAPSAR